MPLTKEQLAKIHQKDAAMADALKRDPMVDYHAGWFFVTLNTTTESPILSTCVGSPSIADGQPGAPRCEYTKLGEGVIDAWRRNADIYDHVVADMCEAMPEHFHGLIYLEPGGRRHLGQIIKGFMIGCSHAYWDTLGIPWREMTYTKGVQTPQYQDRDHTRSYRGPALFRHGYNDVEPITPEELEIKRAYIRDQARKRLIQGDHHDCFRKHRNCRSANWTTERILGAINTDHFLHRNPEQCRVIQQDVLARLNTDAPQYPIDGTDTGKPLLDYMGCNAVMTATCKLPLVCHRADAGQFERQRHAVLDAARHGAVIVSAFISPKEREIREQLMVEMLPIVEIMDNGFSERYKPAGKAFYAMAENRLVQITPWRYIYEKDTTVSRGMCLVMNALACVISGVKDDWWKTC